MTDRKEWSLMADEAQLTGQDEIEALLRQTNANVYQRVLPGQTPNRQILLVPRSDIERLTTMLQPGKMARKDLSRS